MAEPLLTVTDKITGRDDPCYKIAIETIQEKYPVIPIDRIGYFEGDRGETIFYLKVGDQCDHDTTRTKATCQISSANFRGN